MTGTLHLKEFRKTAENGSYIKYTFAVSPKLAALIDFKRDTQETAEDKNRMELRLLKSLLKKEGVHLTGLQSYNEDDEPHGSWEIWDENGEQLEKKTYENGDEIEYSYVKAKGNFPYRWIDPNTSRCTTLAENEDALYRNVIAYYASELEEDYIYDMKYCGADMQHYLFITLPTEEGELTTWTFEVPLEVAAYAFSDRATGYITTENLLEELHEEQDQDVRLISHFTLNEDEHVVDGRDFDAPSPTPF